MFQDPEMVKIVGTMPMRTLAAFGTGLVHEKLDSLLDELRSSQGGERG